MTSRGLTLNELIDELSDGFRSEWSTKFDHMEEVFMPDKQGNEKPRLPFNQYIVEWGYHPLYEGALQNPNGIMAKMAKKNGKSYRAVYKIPSLSGAEFEAVVVCGSTMNCSGDAPYEVIMPTPWLDKDDDLPLGEQTDEDLTVLLAKLIAYAKEY